MRSTTVLVLLFAACVVGQYWKTYGSDEEDSRSQPSPRVRGDERRAGFRDNRGQVLNQDERRAFIQGKWDARRSARSEQRQGSNSNSVASAYQRGQDAWGAVSSTDRGRASPYVRGSWPSMCPNNGMGRETLAKFIPPGASAGWVTKSLAFVKRSRRCNDISGCTEWTVEPVNTLNDEHIKFARPEGKPELRLWVENMAVNNIGLRYMLMFQQCDSCTAAASYSPRRPYAFQFNDVLILGRPGLFTGSIGNSCASLFTDVLRKQYPSQSSVWEIQYAIYGTF